MTDEQVRAELKLRGLAWSMGNFAEGQGRLPFRVGTFATGRLR